MSLYNIRGILTVPLRKKDTILRTDAAVYVGLYVKLQGKAGVEVVKVLWVDDTGVVVEREQDNTEALEFNVGDTVEYVLTAAEIVAQQPSVTIAVDGALEYSDGKLSYQTVTWDELGATQYVGSYTNLIIGRDEQAYGCCDGNNSPAPLRPVPFYLTSRPYPVEVIEGWTSTASWVKARDFGVNVDNWSSEASWVSGTLRTILNFYGLPPTDFWTSDASWVSGTLRTILRTYVPPSNSNPGDTRGDMWTSDGSWVTGTLKAILVIYSNYPPDTWTADASWVSGTLT